MEFFLLFAPVIWFVSGWAIAFSHLPLSRIRVEPQPVLTIAAILVGGAIFGLFGLSVLQRRFR